MEPKGNDMSDELVERLRKLAEQATPGERELNGAGQLVIDDGPPLFELPRRTKHYTADHWFIAACSPDNVLALLARLSRPSTADAVAWQVREIYWHEEDKSWGHWEDDWEEMSLDEPRIERPREEGVMRQFRPLYTHPIGETGDTDELVERAGSRFEHIAGLLRANEDKLSGDTLALLTSLRAERDDAAIAGSKHWKEQCDTWATAVKNAESALAAEKLLREQAEMERDRLIANPGAERYWESRWRDEAERVAALVGLLRRYRNETPLGHQPHMIAHEVDAALATEA